MTHARKLSLTIASIFALAMTAAPALAEDAAEPAADPHAWSLWAASGVAFAALILFMVVTHRRSAREVNRLSAMEQRLDAAENAQRLRAKT